MIYKAAKEKRTILAAQMRKRDNVIRHSKPGTVELVPQRKKNVVTVVE